MKLLVLVGLLAVGVSTGLSGETKATADTAIFAGGCFWCMEASFEGIHGIKSVISGYTGGFKKNPTYDEVSAGKTGHAESILLIYNPREISYSKLLDAFWHNVDPTAKGRQFCDVGTQYRSVVFYRNEEQKRLAEESSRKLEEMSQFKGRIQTEITAASTFYPAEEYHQDFYKKNPERYKSYRTGCGRDKRLKEIWGDAAPQH